LPRFSGHVSFLQKGVPDAQDPSPVSPRMPTAERRAASRRAPRVGTGAGLRALGAGQRRRAHPGRARGRPAPRARRRAPSPSGGAATRLADDLRGTRPATASTPHWARACSRPANGRGATAAASARRPQRRGRSARVSRAGILHSADMPPWPQPPRSPLKGDLTSTPKTQAPICPNNRGNSSRGGLGGTAASASAWKSWGAA